MTVVCEGEADLDRLRAALADRLLISPDEIELVADIEEGPTIVDNRY
jgi:phenylacetate-CoA ligase